MRILQIIYSLGNGGAEKFTVELSNYLSQEHEVVLLTVAPFKDWMIQLDRVSANVELLSLGVPYKKSLKLLILLYHKIRELKPDIVHIHSSILVVYAFVLSLILRKVKFIQTVHNTVTTAYKKVFDLLYLLRWIPANLEDVVISNQIFNEFKSRYPKLDFHVIENGISAPKLSNLLPSVIDEVSSYRLNQDTKVFLAIGNYSNYKNFTMLTKVFSKLFSDGLDVQLLIIGGGVGANESNYNEVARIKSPNTHQLGLKKNVADYLYCADALILSSTHEGMPLVILEAFAMGRPVLATPAGGVKDMIKNSFNGFLTEDLSVGSLRDCILHFCNLDASQISLLRQNSKSSYEISYSMSFCANKYLRLYAK